MDRIESEASQEAAERIAEGMKPYLMDQVVKYREEQDTASARTHRVEHPRGYI